MAQTSRTCDGDSDAAAIKRSLDDPRAFTVLFERHARVLYAYVARRVGEQVAEDVVAETFLAAFRRRRSYDRQHTDARPWLYGIASHLIRRQHRSEARWYRMLSRLPPADRAIEPPTERVNTRVVAQSMSRQLAAALTKLHKRDRDVVLLIAWAELSHEEVAEALNIPLGTVRSRLHRARRILRAELGGDP